MSSCDILKIDALKLKVKNEVLKLRNKERSLIEELSATKGEISNFLGQLETLKKQLSLSLHQFSLIEICEASEDVKIEAHTSILDKLLEGYQDLFKTEDEIAVPLNEQREKEAEKLGVMRQNNLEIVADDDKLTKDVIAIEKVCEIIERDCMVLKKRNYAILLKLRRKMLEVENIRRGNIKQALKKE